MTIAVALALAATSFGLTLVLALAMLPFLAPMWPGDLPWVAEGFYWLVAGNTFSFACVHALCLRRLAIGRHEALVLGGLAGLVAFLVTTLVTGTDITDALLVTGNVGTVCFIVPGAVGGFSISGPLAWRRSRAASDVL